MSHELDSPFETNPVSVDKIKLQNKTNSLDLHFVTGHTVNKEAIRLLAQILSETVIFLPETSINQ